MSHTLTTSIECRLAGHVRAPCRRLFLLSLLLLASAGCCPNITRAVHELRPLIVTTRINGTYLDHSPSPYGDSLWQLLTGQDIEAGGGQAIQTAVRVAGDRKLTVVRLVNGVETRRRDVPFRFTGGYIRLSRPVFTTSFDMGPLTAIGCGEIAVAAGPQDGDICLYSDSGIALWWFILPVPADPVPRESVFRRAGVETE